MGFLKKVGKAIQKAADKAKELADAVGSMVGGGSGPINPDSPAPRRDPSPKQDAAEKARAKAAQKAGELLGDFVKGVPGAVVAVGHFIENSAHSTGDTLSHAERRLREGKVVDAFWHLNTEPLSDSEKNVLKACQESALIRQGLQAVTTYYAGPLGAAAFSAWYTYRTTGDAVLALKIGLIEGAKAYALQGVDANMSAGVAEEAAAKAVVAGAIGGIAVAASGGNMQDVACGFIMTGGTVAALDGYQLETGRTLGQDLRAAGGAATSSVGGFIMKPFSSPSTEPPPPMPDAEASPAELQPPPQGGIQIENGDWRITWNAIVLKSGKPAVVLTYVGQEPLHQGNAAPN
ncbi:hypothetical protein ABIF35_006561 [Bradyrhizobium japonicum]|uniref:hypothetical protein n=1 Tax=Bradyrhizobium diazoefficiens TaxID=1355477 RepID=UPI00348B258D